MSQERLAYSVPEAAALMGISPRKGWELANTGEWPVFAVGSRVLIARTALDRWIANQQPQPLRRAQ